MVEEEKKKIEEEVSLKEIEEEFEEWLTEEEKKIPQGLQDIDTVVFDLGVSSSGVIVELHTLSGVYVSERNDQTEKVKEILMKGKMARIKGKVVELRKRIYTIDSVEEVNDENVKIPKNRIMKGIITKYGSGISLFYDGQRYFIREGTIGFLILDNLIEKGVDKVVGLISQIEKRVGMRGTYNIIRGIYVILPSIRKHPDILKKVEEEFVEVEKVKKEEEKEEELPDKIEA